VASKLWKEWCSTLERGDNYILGSCWSVGPVNLHVVLYKISNADNWLDDLEVDENGQHECTYISAYIGQVMGIMV
jgi:hypothetical protein